MVEGGHRSLGAGYRRRWPCTGAGPRLSWRRAGSRLCCVSCRVISRPGTGRWAPVRPTSSGASYL